MLRQDAGATFSDKRITVNKPDILLVHRGGLGDFLAAWPAVLSICDQFADHEWFWIGDADRLAWLSPLGVRACPRDLSRAFEELFVSRCWPEAFSETQIYWFGLARRPPVVEHPRLVFLRGLGGAPHVRSRGARRGTLCSRRSSSSVVVGDMARTFRLQNRAGKERRRIGAAFSGHRASGQAVAPGAIF